MIIDQVLIVAGRGYREPGAVAASVPFDAPASERNLLIVSVLLEDSGTREAGRQLRAGLSALRPNGAGHFVKMVHNGIEYGIMASYAEGLGILRDANIGKQQGAIDAETTPLRDPEHYQYDLDLGARSRRCGGEAVSSPRGCWT